MLGSVCVKMTSAEHIKLSDFIKSIHKKLRDEAQVLGTEEAWKNHCGDSENLRNYASAMQQLAVDHWDKNSTKNKKVLSRIFWVYSACIDYFANIEKYRAKEVRIVRNCYPSEKVKHLLPTINSDNKRNSKYRLLDVGSCYNPFNHFGTFEVVPIDIAPGNQEVLKSDFLNLDIGDETIIKDKMLTQLKKDWFDIIVFSLLLEYFPSPKQRLKCCLNAYRLLKVEGILAIVTPDSNHVSSNAKIIKSWQYVLAKHGFVRVKYEKLPYMHCMLFRKASFRVVAERWAEIHESENLFKEIFIPQDFTETNVQKLKQKYTHDTDNWNKSSFLQDLDCNISELF